MATEARSWWVLPASAAMLLWPAAWNGYPIVFADTGTYLSQAIERYAGWDRPVFYSLFMLPLHLSVTVWPVVVAQALLTVWVLWQMCAGMLGRVPDRWFVAGVAVLAAATWLPWLVCELMPDLFTPLLVLVLVLLAERRPGREHWILVGLAALLIATQLSSLPLAIGLGALLAWRERRQMQGAVIVLAPVVLAVVALCCVNLAAHGQLAVSPYGSVFALARVIYDGPGMAALQRDCPERGWRLCGFLDRFPGNADDFLWRRDSPLNLAGGPKLVAAEAPPIILDAVATAPASAAWAAVGNTLAQMTRFASGDGLEAWPNQVTPWIARDFPPRELRWYQAARQQHGSLAVPPALAWLHMAVDVAGVAGCLVLLPMTLRRRDRCAGLLLAVLVALPLGAAITGGLSGPHDRYQARIMWLAPFAAVLALAALRRTRPA